MNKFTLPIIFATALLLCMPSPGWGMELSIAVPDTPFYTNNTAVTIGGTVANIPDTFTSDSVVISVNLVEYTDAFSMGGANSGTFVVSADIEQANDTNVYQVKARRRDNNNQDSTEINVVHDNIKPEFLSISTAPDSEPGHTTADSVVINLAVTGEDTFAINGETFNGDTFVKNTYPDSNGYRYQKMLNEGTNEFFFVARDRAGNEQLEVITFERDTIAPFLEIDGPLPKLNREYVYTVSDTVLIEGTIGTDADTLFIEGDTVPFSEGSFDSAVSLVEDTNTFTVRALDSLGNDTARVVAVIKDSADPVLTVTAPDSGEVFGNKSISVTGEIADSYPLDKLIIEGTDYDVTGQNSFNQATTVSNKISDTLYTIRVELVDYAGRYDQDTVYVYVTGEGPEMSVNNFTAGTGEIFQKNNYSLVTNASTITVSGTVGNTADSVGIKINSQGETLVSPGGSNDFSLSGHLGNNSYQEPNEVRLTAYVDYPDTPYTRVTYNVQKDTIPPAYSRISPSASEDTTLTSSTRYNIHFLTEEGVIFRLYQNGELIDIEDLPGGEYDEDKFLETGTNKFVASIQDDLGNTATDTFYIEVDQQPPPLTIINPGDKQSERTVYSDRILVSGITDTEATVRVTSPKESKQVILNDTGQFMTYIKIETGYNQLTVQATDSIGNTHTKGKIVYGLYGEPADVNIREITGPDRLTRGQKSTIYTHEVANQGGAIFSLLDDSTSLTFSSGGEKLPAEMFDLDLKSAFTFLNDSDTGKIYYSIDIPETFPHTELSIDAEVYGYSGGSNELVQDTSALQVKTIGIDPVVQMDIDREEIDFPENLFHNVTNKGSISLEILNSGRAKLTRPYLDIIKLKNKQKTADTEIAVSLSGPQVIKKSQEKFDFQLTVSEKLPTDANVAPQFTLFMRDANRTNDLKYLFVFNPLDTSTVMRRLNYIRANIDSNYLYGEVRLFLADRSTSDTFLFDENLTADSKYLKIRQKVENFDLVSPTAGQIQADQQFINNFHCYPNPFDPRKGATTITFELGQTINPLTLRIFTLTGELVLERKIPQAKLSATAEGKLEYSWDGLNGIGEMIASGGYIAQLVAESNQGEIVKAHSRIAVLKQ